MMVFKALNTKKFGFCFGPSPCGIYNGKQPASVAAILSADAVKGPF